MIKFVHKKHINQDNKDKKIIIYYSIFDIFIGIALLILVIFYINYYLSHTLYKSNDNVSPYPILKNN